MQPSDRIKAVKESRAYKRNLPHIEEPGSTYFITFRTASEIKLSDEAKNIAFQSIKFHDGKQYQLHACVVMDTHVHIIIRPLKESDERYHSIAQILHSIKSYSAHQINKVLNTTGNIWLDESYDRIIRDDEECREKMNYVQNNPVEAGIVQKSENYRWIFLDNSGDRLSS